jgi:hypothetical protein
MYSVSYEIGMFVVAYPILDSDSELEFDYWIAAAPTSSSSGSKSDLGLIIGLSVGLGVLGLLIIAAVAYYFK